MANTKEVRKQIASIKSTQKITSAMEMVAASKMKRTQDLMMVGRPYSNKIQEVISHIATSNSEHLRNNTAYLIVFNNQIVNALLEQG